VGGTCSKFSLWWNFVLLFPAVSVSCESFGPVDSQSNIKISINIFWSAVWFVNFLALFLKVSCWVSERRSQSLSVVIVSFSLSRCSLFILPRKERNEFLVREIFCWASVSRRLATIKYCIPYHFFCSLFSLESLGDYSHFGHNRNTLTYLLVLTLNIGMRKEIHPLKAYQEKSHLFMSHTRDIPKWNSIRDSSASSTSSFSRNWDIFLSPRCDGWVHCRNHW